jgi:hypothetical protein
MKKIYKNLFLISILSIGIGFINYKNIEASENHQSSSHNEKQNACHWPIIKNVWDFFGWCNLEHNKSHENHNQLDKHDNENKKIENKKQESKDLNHDKKIESNDKSNIEEKNLINSSNIEHKFIEISKETKEKVSDMEHRLENEFKEVSKETKEKVSDMEHKFEGKK